MPTRDLSSSLDDDNLLYPGIRSPKFPDGKTYLVPAPSGKDGLLYLQLFELAGQLSRGLELSDEDRRRLEIDDKDEVGFLRKILGKDTFDEMLDDGVPWPKMKEIVQDAFLCWGADEELADAAQAMRRAGKAPAVEAPPANRAQRRAATKKPPGAKRTAKKTAGPKSSPASTATPARTAAPASTPSLKSTPTAQQPQAAAV